VNINCQYDYVDNPHVSHYLIVDTVNVHASVTCTWPVTLLLMTVSLYRNDVSVGVTEPQPKPGPASATIKWNSATDNCISGSYQGTSQTDITFPPGYDPPGGLIGKVGNVVPVTCP
jgi:hypothetical protein